MGKPTGFLEFERVAPPNRPVEERVRDYKEVMAVLPEEQVVQQAARCMDCGIPFCHNGCPVDNLIPEWNDLVYQGRWEEAIAALHTTNNFPDVTGRVCPAPCESACVLGINAPAVTIKNLEKSIIDKAWENDWVQPQINPNKTGRKIAVIGSGPAGMAASQQLARAGHTVDLYEKDDRIGGLLRYGIPDFKLDKSLLDRRMEQMAAEGVSFITNTAVGTDKPMQELVDNYDAVLLTIGAGKPRDLQAAGREAKGVHFAMEFLSQQNKRVAGDTIPDEISLLATDKHVVVIGGGDTGADCVGTSNRQGCKTLHQLELLPKPPASRADHTPWPMWPHQLRTSTSHEEGCERMWSVNTKEIVQNDAGEVTAIKCVELDWEQDENGRWNMSEIAGSEFELKADLVLLAMGFVSPVLEGIADTLGLETDGRGNVVVDTSFKTSHDKVYAAGDTHRGASLVVWAIREGRLAAENIDKMLRVL